MIKVIALATASVQTTPTRWFCLLSDYYKHTCLSFLDVVLCSVLLTFSSHFYKICMSSLNVLARISQSNCHAL